MITHNFHVNTVLTAVIVNRNYFLIFFYNFIAFYFVQKYDQENH